MLSQLFSCLGMTAQPSFILMVIGVLIFGRRLPEVTRSLARSIREFKKGLIGIEEDIWSVPESSAAKQPERVSESISKSLPEFNSEASDHVGAALVESHSSDT